MYAQMNAQTSRMKFAVGSLEFVEADCDLLRQGIPSLDVVMAAVGEQRTHYQDQAALGVE